MFTARIAPRDRSFVAFVSRPGEPWFLGTAGWTREEALNRVRAGLSNGGHGAGPLTIEDEQPAPAPYRVNRRRCA